MSLSYYLYYKGRYYDVGTIVKIRTRYKGIIHSTYEGNGNFEGVSKYSRGGGPDPESYIVEIVKPVYYIPPEPEQPKKANIFVRSGSGSSAHNDDIFHGLLLYIVVMLVGTIFKDRWLIWIFATIFFFGWKAKK